MQSRTGSGAREKQHPLNEFMETKTEPIFIIVCSAEKPIVFLVYSKHLVQKGLRCRLVLPGVYASTHLIGLAGVGTRPRSDDRFPLCSLSSAADCKAGVAFGVRTTGGGSPRCRGPRPSPLSQQRPGHPRDLRITASVQGFTSAPTLGLLALQGGRRPVRCRAVGLGPGPW